MPSSSCKKQPTFKYSFNAFTLLLTIVSTLKLAAAADEVTFHYHGGGCPESWYRTYPMCGSDDIDTMKTMRQSPIDIDLSQIKPHPAGLSPLLIRNYHLRAGKWRLEKARGSVFLKVDGISPFIEIPSTYMFLQAHLHWGTGVACKIGSEHSVDGQYYPLEIHLVHYNRARDEYAVVAILYETGAPNTQGADNEKLRSIFEILETDALQQGYNQTGGNSVLSFRSAFTLDNLLPPNWDSYYRYNGSLTTPPCSQNVIWTIMKDRSHISKRQLALLADLKQCDASAKVCYPRELIAPNLRPTQRLNDRPIYLYTSGSTKIIKFSPAAALLMWTLFFALLPYIKICV